MKKSISDKDYFLINICLIVFFIIGTIYLFTTESPLSCYYTNNYSKACSTCGITRDFKLIFSLKFDKLINPKSILFFTIFFLFFFTRLVGLYFVKKIKPFNKFLIIDLIFFTILFLTMVCCISY